MTKKFATDELVYLIKIVDSVSGEENYYDYVIEESYVTHKLGNGLVEVDNNVFNDEHVYKTKEEAEEEIRNLMISGEME